MAAMRLTHRHPLLAVMLMLCLSLAQLGVAIHGVIHPGESRGATQPDKQKALPHSPACEHFTSQALGSALPATALAFADAPALFFIKLPPRLPEFRASHRHYQSRAPPLFV